MWVVKMPVDPKIYACEHFSNDLFLKSIYQATPSKKKSTAFYKTNVYFIGHRIFVIEYC